MRRDMTITPEAADQGRPAHTATVRMRIGTASFDGTVSITSGGLLAVGGLVSAILLSTAVLVLAATRGPPPLTRLLLRR